MDLNAPEPSRLDPALRLMLLFSALNHTLMVASKKLELQSGITERQRQVLALLLEQPTISAGGMATVLQVHPSTVVGVVRRLRQRRLLRTEENEEDRRCIRLILTERGERAARLASVEEAIRRALGALPASSLSGVCLAMEAMNRELGG